MEKERVRCLILERGNSFYGSGKESILFGESTLKKGGATFPQNGEGKEAGERLRSAKRNLREARTSGPKSEKGGGVLLEKSGPPFLTRSKRSTSEGEVGGTLWWGCKD